MPKRLSAKRIAGFQQHIRAYYQDHKRDLPWRQTRDPYKILVSEVMLQQTQVTRVLGKYSEFTGELPDFTALAAAPKPELLRLWQGLGYNRRALALQQTAVIIHEHYHDLLPETAKELTSLPGIGPYTAGALQAFVFNHPVVFVETNIRSVFIHEFFPGSDKVNDQQLLPLIEQTLDRHNPREWYYALMDYGSFLKQINSNPSRRSQHYQRQTAFAGSNRQLRGAILRQLLVRRQVSLAQLAQILGKAQPDLEKVLINLSQEGFVTLQGNHVRLQD